MSQASDWGRSTEMRDAILSRVALVKEAIALEAAGGDWEPMHAAAVLGVSRSTLYKIPYIMRRASHPTGRGRGKPVRIRPQVVREWQRMNTGPSR